MKKENVLFSIIAILLAVILVIQVYAIYDKMFAEVKEEPRNPYEVEKVQGQSLNEKDIVIRNGAEDCGKLTFSCNVDWGEEVIPDMLKIFRDNNIHITFFVSGRWAENNPELLKDMYLAGHEIQSHGYRHKLCTQVSADVAKEEILKTEAAILNILGIKTTIFAPPSGDYNQSTVELCRSLGYKLALWSADTIDWREGSTAAVIKERILKKQLNGAIVLMHPKPETVKALPDLISEIQKKGLEIVPLYRLPL